MVNFATPYSSISKSQLKDRIWEYSDSLIPETLRQELLDGVALLELVPETKKDWHPGSNNQVWNLVHPSLFPIIYGQTRNIAGDIVEQEHTGPGFSAFCWLPSEFQLLQDGKVSITSYINNLHPGQYRSIYCTLEKIFEQFVPLFESVLTDIVLHPSATRTSTSSASTSSHVPTDQPSVSSGQVSLAGRSLQVVVKMSTIVLTPERPSYPGGMWHVEGMRNENIVASGIYYYETTNISESELFFRRKMCAGRWGTIRWNEEVGSVKTPENGCLVFPNYYQHRVSPFELIDNSKPGHRKILVFFLVNPDERILSTSTIPPQQLDWFLEELVQVPPFNELPLEIVSHIVSFLDWPLSLTKAKEVREGMVRERKTMRKGDEVNVRSKGAGGPVHFD